MKNIPITQRVSSGLFGSKKQNPTAVAKQVGDKDKVKVGNTSTTTTVSAGDMILNPGTKGKAGNLTSQRKGEKMSNAAWKKYLANESSERKAKRHAKDVELGIRQKATKGTPDTYTQGPDKVTETKEFVPTQERDKNRALNPWEVRMQSRAIKKSGRDMRKSQNRLDKTNRSIQKLEEKGITSGRKYDRLMSKQQENQSELAAFKGNMKARQRQAEMSASGLMQDTFDSAQRDSELGDFSYSKQKDIISAGDYKSNAPKEEPKKDPNDDPYGFKSMLTDVDAVGSMKKSNFFKGKAPLKKGYFNK